MNPHACVVRNELVAAGADDDLWSSIIGEPSVKERLLNHAMLALSVRRRVSFSAIPLHGLILLVGPPGTGKTTLARGLPSVLAKGLDGGKMRIIEINPHGLMSAEHGQSQKLVAQLLEETVPELCVDRLPTVVLIDEVESMAVARAEASLSANPVDVHRATDAVLTALDRAASAHPHIVWVTTSNFAEALDDAFRSRADATIEVPLPGPDGIREILKDTLMLLADGYPNLKQVAGDARLGDVAAAAGPIDGRRARKLVIEALAAQRVTAIDPGCLTIDHLLSVAHSQGVR